MSSLWSATSGNERENEQAGPVVDTTMMPDDELVLRMLRENDGHMWQGDIASELEWSPSKTSRLLSALEDDGSIARRQVGREKIVYLPPTIPEDFFDDREASAIDR